MFNVQVFFKGLLLTAGCVVFASAAFGAGGEVSASGGGASVSGGFGTHGAFGGGGGVRLGGRALIFGEFTYVSLGSYSIGTQSSPVGASFHFANFGGGLDYSFRDRGPSAKVIPYCLLAVGGAHLAGSVSGGGSSVSAGIGNQAYVGIGGGVRVYVGESWGFKPEVRFQRYAGSIGGQTADENSAMYTLGLFYDFGK